MRKISKDDHYSPFNPFPILIIHDWIDAFFLNSSSFTIRYIIKAVYIFKHLLLEQKPKWWKWVIPNFFVDLRIYYWRWVCLVVDRFRWTRRWWVDGWQDCYFFARWLRQRWVWVCWRWLCRRGWVGRVGPRQQALSRLLFPPSIVCCVFNL